MFNIFSIAEEHVVGIVRAFYGLVETFTQPLSVLLSSMNDDFPIVFQVINTILGTSGMRFSLLEFMFIAGLPSYIIFKIVKFFVDLVL